MTSCGFIKLRISALGTSTFIVVVSSFYGLESKFRSLPMPGKHFTTSQPLVISSSWILCCSVYNDTFLCLKVYFAGYDYDYSCLISFAWIIIFHIFSQSVSVQRYYFPVSTILLECLSSSRFSVSFSWRIKIIILIVITG